VFRRTMSLSPAPLLAAAPTCSYLPNRRPAVDEAEASLFRSRDALHHLVEQMHGNLAEIYSQHAATTLVPNVTRIVSLASHAPYHLPAAEPPFAMQFLVREGAVLLSQPADINGNPLKHHPTSASHSPAACSSPLQGGVGASGPVAVVQRVTKADCVTPAAVEAIDPTDDSQPDDCVVVEIYPNSVPVEESHAEEGWLETKFIETVTVTTDPQLAKAKTQLVTATATSVATTTVTVVLTRPVSPAAAKKKAVPTKDVHLSLKPLAETTHSDDEACFQDIERAVTGLIPEVPEARAPLISLPLVNSPGRSIKAARPSSGSTSMEVAFHAPAYEPSGEAMLQCTSFPDPLLPVLHSLHPKAKYMKFAEENQNTVQLRNHEHLKAQRKTLRTNEDTLRRPREVNCKGISLFHGEISLIPDPRYSTTLHESKHGPNPVLAALQARIDERSKRAQDKSGQTLIDYSCENVRRAAFISRDYLKELEGDPKANYTCLKHAGYYRPLPSIQGKKDSPPICEKPGCSGSRNIMIRHPAQHAAAIANALNQPQISIADTMIGQLASMTLQSFCELSFGRSVVSMIIHSWPALVQRDMLWYLKGFEHLTADGAVVQGSSHTSVDLPIGGAVACRVVKNVNKNHSVRMAAEFYDSPYALPKWASAEHLSRNSKLYRKLAYAAIDLDEAMSAGAADRPKDNSTGAKMEVDLHLMVLSMPNPESYALDSADTYPAALRFFRETVKGRSWYPKAKNLPPLLTGPDGQDYASITQTSQKSMALCAGAAVDEAFEAVAACGGKETLVVYYTGSHPEDAIYYHRKDVTCIDLAALPYFRVMCMIGVQAFQKGTYRVRPDDVRRAFAISPLSLEEAWEIAGTATHSLPKRADLPGGISQRAWESLILLEMYHIVRAFMMTNSVMHDAYACVSISLLRFRERLQLAYDAETPAPEQSPPAQGLEPEVRQKIRSLRHCEMNGLCQTAPSPCNHIAQNRMGRRGCTRKIRAGEGYPVPVVKTGRKAEKRRAEPEAEPATKVGPSSALLTRLGTAPLPAAVTGDKSPEGSGAGKVRKLENLTITVPNTAVGTPAPAVVTRAPSPPSPVAAGPRSTVEAVPVPESSKRRHAGSLAELRESSAPKARRDPQGERSHPSTADAAASLITKGLSLEGDAATAANAALTAAIKAAALLIFSQNEAKAAARLHSPRDSHQHRPTSRGDRSGTRRSSSRSRATPATSPGSGSDTRRSRTKRSREDERPDSSRSRHSDRGRSGHRDAERRDDSRNKRHSDGERRSKASRRSPRKPARR
jgi:hypothetical protein